MYGQLPQPAPPTGNRLALVTPDDNGASILIATALSFIFSFVILGFRLLVVKWRRHGIDDLVLTLAYVLAIFQYTFIFSAQENGLGKATKLVEAAERLDMEKAVYTARAVFMSALCLSKVSILLVIRSLFQWENRRRIWFIDIAIGLCAAWGLVAVLCVSIGSPPGPKFGGEKHMLVRLRVIMLLDTLTEMAIFALPTIFLNDFGVPMRKKILVITAFASRFPLIALSILYFCAYSRFIKGEGSGVEFVPTVVWQETLLGYSLMSATIPCLRNFVEGFTTGGIGLLAGVSHTDDRSLSGSSQLRSSQDMDSKAETSTSKLDGQMSELISSIDALEIEEMPVNNQESQHRMTSIVV